MSKTAHGAGGLKMVNSTFLSGSGRAQYTQKVAWRACKGQTITLVSWCIDVLGVCRGRGSDKKEKKESAGGGPCRKRTREGEV